MDMRKAPLRPAGNLRYSLSVNVEATPFMRSQTTHCLFIFLLFCGPLSAVAQGPAIEVGDLACLPNEENATIAATVAPEVGGGSVRLYFRRLNPEGDFYYNKFHSTGNGSYWTVFPKPEDREQTELQDEWWEELQERDWMEGHDRDWLEEWLDERDHEAAEYYVAVHDSAGVRLARSPTRLVDIFDQDDCEVELDPSEDGWAQNLTIGETHDFQFGEPVYHWLCDGIVTRIDEHDIIRADEFCRACVVAAIPGWVFPTAGAVVGALVANEIIGDDDPPASPSRP